MRERKHGGEGRPEGRGRKEWQEGKGGKAVCVDVPVVRVSVCLSLCLKVCL